ncbi:WXG100 family type VII secretion target [Kutzneria buriramensis]|uniref:Type VII secretion system (Wss) protein ESAT-6 n=1 Tax=Kutzneria buriramensis TaxID=1045776 RepID=A0A3E0I9X4_9PSEU|nr:WXG100 family type VII secretion target [Kutzneria buriramensis]REH55534.1 type VII secretion system (Wss) protein ESAT-6 [Kutzneria buriramensis]
MNVSPAHLDYLSQTSRRLGVTDPVEEYYAPLVGQWSALRDEADRWRQAAKAAGDVTDTLTKQLGGLDASWQGKDADSFMAYMQAYGLSGHDLADAMNAMADALQQTADGIEHLVDQLGDTLADSADTVSDALSVPVHGEKRATEHLDDQHGPTRQLFESARDVLEAFTKLCGSDAFSKITVKHPMPTSNWSYSYAPPAPTTAPAHAVTAQPPATHAAAQTPAAATAQPAVASPAPSADTTPQAAAPASHAAAAGGAHIGGGGAMPAAAGIAHDAAPVQAPGAGTVSGLADQTATEHFTPAPQAAAAAPAQGGAAGSSGMGMMGGMGGQKGQGGEDTEHKSKIRLSGDLRDLLGAPEKTAPTVIGEK